MLKYSIYACLVHLVGRLLFTFPTQPPGFTVDVALSGALVHHPAHLWGVLELQLAVPGAPAAVTVLPGRLLGHAEGARLHHLRCAGFTVSAAQRGGWPARQPRSLVHSRTGEPALCRSSVGFQPSVTVGSRWHLFLPVLTPC